jgi:hypothetical protein
LDEAKRKRLLKIIEAQPCWEDGRAVVTVDEFFDGNDELGSIGCNLSDHPGIPEFRRVLKSLEARRDVREVWMSIYDLDSGWPFCETVFVVGAIPVGELRELVKSLAPSEVGLRDLDEPYSRAKSLAGEVRTLWWD